MISVAQLLSGTGTSVPGMADLQEGLMEEVKPTSVSSCDTS